MSGIAEILTSLDYVVQGSDQAESANVKRLRDKGIDVKVGHAASNLKTQAGAAPAVVVISSAIKNSNPELIAARERGIPIIRRAEMLAELMRLKWAVAISGTHGKTTTTSMVGQMLEAAGFDPTVINGGIVHAYGTNVRLGQSDIMVVEADESDGTFNRLPASVAVVTNIDPEHLDHYGSFENAKAAYRQFIHNLPFYGYAVLCIDHPEVQALIPSVKDRKIITYGLNPQADVRAENIHADAQGSVFDVIFSERVSTTGKDITLKDIHLPMLGRHNVQNSLASLAIAMAEGIPAALMKKALSQFAGVRRRFTKTGETYGITIIDDYAHHPVEIEVVLETARQAASINQGRVIAVMQPHRYTRLHDLFEEFCTCFNNADTVIIADVYEAGEEPIAGANKLALVEGLKAHGHREVIALPAKTDLPHMIAKIARPNDFVICMGAGDITSWAYALPAQLEEEIAKAKGSAA
jgi:UDP-N-acetylmuramate--alanine ligase